MLFPKKTIDNLFDLTPAIKKLSKLEKLYPRSKESDKELAEFNEKLKEINQDFNAYISSLDEMEKEEKEDFNLE